MRSLAMLLSLVSAAACASPLPPPEAGERRDNLLPASHLELTTAQGEVIGTDRLPPGQELAQGLTIRLQADRHAPIVVQVAPGWFLDESGIAYGPRERLEVSGWREVRRGQPVLVVREVRQGERRLLVRDLDGRPLWTPAPPR
jgi:hypothetical protein